MADTTRLSSLKMVYSFFGPPGAGKGTVAREAVRRLGFQMISTGDLLRAEVARNSDLGNMIRATVARGALVADEIVKELVFNVLKHASVQVFILDGYPRNQSQAEDFLAKFRVDFPDVQFRVVHFDLADSEICARVAARLMCERKTCQATYSLKIHQPKVSGICDLCGASLVRRLDDSDVVVKERLMEYEQLAKGVFLAYDRLGVGVCRLDLFGKSEEVVFQEFVTQCVT